MEIRVLIIYLLFVSLWITTPIYDGLVVIRLFDITLIFISIISLLLINKNTKLPISTIYLLFSINLGYVFILSIFNTNITESIKEAIQLIEIFLFIMNMMFISHGLSGNKVINTMYISLLTVAIYFVIQNFISGNFIGMKDSAQKVLPGYVASLSYVYLLFTRRNFHFIIFILMSASTFLTLERKSWLALLLTIILLSYLYFKLFKGKLLYVKKSTLKFATLIILLLVISISFTSKNEQITEQFNSLIEVVFENNNYSTASNRERTELLNTSVDIFLEKPFFGVGIGDFKEASNNEAGSPHNEFLQKLTEQGIFGLLIYISFWCFLVFQLTSMIQHIRKTNNYNYLITVFLIISISVFGFVINLFRASGLITFMFLFIPIALVIVYKRKIINHRISDRS